MVSSPKISRHGPFRPTVRMFFLTLMVALGANAVRAHDPFSSSATAKIDATELRLVVAMAPVAAQQLLDAPTETITTANFARFGDALEKRALSLYFITAHGEPLRPLGAKATFNADGDIEYEIRYPAPSAGPLRFRALYLSQMPPRHIGTLRVIDANGADLDWAHLEMDTPQIEVPFPRMKPDGLNGTAITSTTTSPTSGPGFTSFLKLGIEHILTGYDHLLFLAALLLACRRFATMAGIITCFTLAHSLTLALAALEVVSLPSRVVEPLIAASIVVVGLENLFRRHGEPKGRWAVTFGFGLVHGFGFAGALRETGLGTGGGSLLPPLFAFNLGVEIGQVAVAALLLPVLFRLRRSDDFVRFGLPAASTIVIALGGYWLLQRTIFS